MKENQNKKNRKKLILALLACLVSVGLIVGGVFMMFYQVTKQASNVVALGGIYDSRIQEMTNDNWLNEEDYKVPAYKYLFEDDFTYDGTNAANRNIAATDFTIDWSQGYVPKDTKYIDFALLPEDITNINEFQNYHDEISKNPKVSNTGTMPQYVRMRGVLTVEKWNPKASAGAGAYEFVDLTGKNAAVGELFACISNLGDNWTGTGFTIGSAPVGASGTSVSAAIGTWYYTESSTNVSTAADRKLIALQPMTDTLNPVFTNFTYKDTLGVASNFDFSQTRVTLKLIADTIQQVGSAYNGYIIAGTTAMTDGPSAWVAAFSAGVGGTNSQSILSNGTNAATEGNISDFHN